VFISGQTPRAPDGRRLLDRPFAEQVERTLQNLDALARAAGGSLRNAVKVNVFLKPGADIAAFKEASGVRSPGSRNHHEASAGILLGA